ncbi:UNVERIFIED_CONTAM: hypothetical protein Sradi_5696300 [Sesamum radiatum]|uniref:Uncharacterized protein n=1 Tax=Sesamum radiatum TaxID=300843 RepID=A0AAW2L3Y0_SESRA
MEYWTEDGLSVVASGRGVPLYTNKITKHCSRLDYARICVMLNYDSTLPKHLVVISPFLREGKEIPTKVDVEYEWLPQHCKQCQSLGHTALACYDVKKMEHKTLVIIFVKRQQLNSGVDRVEVEEDLGQKVADLKSTKVNSEEPEHPQMTNRDTSMNSLPQQKTVNEDEHAQQMQRNKVGHNCGNSKGAVSNIHCHATNRCTHATCLIFVLYVSCGLIARQNLWNTLQNLAESITDDSWLVLGDFNVVIDNSEICGRAADTRTSMTDFQGCMVETSLVHLPFVGAPFTWHNCSKGGRSLWKRLDRMLVNEVWLTQWPNSSYLSGLPSTSDHSPLIILGTGRRADPTLFRFDNFLTKRPGFLEAVQLKWRRRIAGTAMYEVMCKLKDIKQTFR